MISLVMPTYNGERFLREQLDSIYSQTLVPDEVVVVDDCSKDGTVDILREYKEKYGLIYYVNDKNLGYNRNFAKGISLAKGDYISLCDQDDIWLPHKIETLYNKIREIEEGRPACVSSGILVYDSTTNRIVKNKINKDYSGDSPFYFYQSQGCTMFFNRRLMECLGDIPEGIMYDAYIGMTSVILGNRYHISTPLMKYRIHSNNAVGTGMCNYIPHVSDGRRLYEILAGKRSNTLKVIRNMFVDDKVADMHSIDKAISLLSHGSGLRCVQNILKMPYYDMLDKFCTLFFMLKNTVICQKYKH